MPGGRTYSNSVNWFCIILLIFGVIFFMVIDVSRPVVKHGGFLIEKMVKENN